MIPYKERSYDPSKPVQVYRNLSRSCYSIRQSGLVIGHSDFVCLENCKFVVIESGRQRVLKTKEKNVHAFIQGYITKKNTKPKNVVKYNPYLNEKFMQGKSQIHESDYAYISMEGVFV